MRAIEEKFGSYADERPAVFRSRSGSRRTRESTPPPSTACTGWRAKIRHAS